MSVWSRIGFIVVLTGSVLTGCNATARMGSLKHMTEVGPGGFGLQPDSGKSLLVFIRPNDDLSAYQAGLSSISQEGVEFIGYLADPAALRYEVSPGSYTIMSSGSGARTDYMEAVLHPDTTYYVKVRGWTNGWGAFKFFLEPYTSADTQENELYRLLEGTRLVETNASTFSHFTEHRKSYESKASEYYTKPHLEKSVLRGEDGWK